MNVLIVDDERTAVKDILRVLKQLLPDADVRSAESAEEALKLCRANGFDVMLIDIRMPDMDGLALAAEIKRIHPMINIIITTAYPEYALESYKLYASDYLLKPVLQEDLRKAINNLRNPVKEAQKGLYVQCFGNFAVFYDGESVSFGRSKTLELFAYLIYRKGAHCTNAEIRAALWADHVSNDERQMHYFAQIVYEFKSKLKQLGLSDLFVHSRDSYAIVPGRIRCDYYQAMERDPLLLGKYEGEYMAQYEWADIRVWH